ncbi:MAG TPA: caspase family protein [Ohtaekwangia sp.]|nr:caspase family protein [Ohtaekwangia sp.]
MCRKFLLALSLVLLAGDMFAQFKLYEKGHDSYTAGKYDESVKAFSEYLTKNTRDKSMDVEVYYVRGLAYFKKGDFRNAVGDFEESLLQNHLNAGNIHWFKAKSHVQLAEFDDAIQDYTNAIRILGTNNDVRTKLLLERGQTYKRSGKMDLAQEDFRAGLELSPGNRDLEAELKGQPLALHNTPNTETNKKATSHQNNQPVTKTKQEHKAEQPKETVVAKTDVNESVSKPVVTGGKEVVQANTKKQTGKNPFAKASSREKQDNTPAPKSNADDANLEAVRKANLPTTNVPDTRTSNTTSLADAYKDEKRYALIIGNSTYPKSIGLLKNPVNDASDLARELEASNFEVQLLLNATYGQMRAAMLKFKEKIDAGVKDKTVSLFYFAGHGLQFEDENYLVPVDAMIEYQDDISRYCFGVQKMVLANMERSNSRMNIVILDACRNNPFPALTRSIGGEQGLGEMRRARGSFIAYATAPGSVASDGTGRNGLYTQELLRAMRKPGLTIEQVFKEVRANVLRLSNDKQNTWDSSNIVGEFYFKF